MVGETQIFKNTFARSLFSNVGQHSIFSYILARVRGVFSSHTHGKLILGDVEQLWSLDFTRGQTCSYDTMMK